MVQIPQLVERIAGARVLCLGDIMLDRFIYGKATRISPEAPVPVVHVQRDVLIPGGVGNVVKNLQALGAQPHTISIVGNDSEADSLAGLLGGNHSLLRDTARPTIVKTRVVAGIQQIVRFDAEMTAPIPPDMEDRIIAAVQNVLPGMGCVALSDYAKGVISPRVCAQVIRMAAEQGIPVAIDPKGRDYTKYTGAFLIKPNRRELAEAVGRDVDSLDDVIAAGREVMLRYNVQHLLVTLSEKGMVILQTGSADPVVLPSRARDVYDVTGAGDTVLSCITASLAVGAGLEDGARLANVAAGIVVGKVGTAVASPKEIVQSH